MQETADGIAHLRAVGLPVGGVVVNQVRPRDLRVKDLAAARKGELDRAAIGSDLVAAGVEVSDDLLDGLLAEARDHAVRRALEDAQRKLVKRMSVPAYDLPRLAAGRRPGRPLRARRPPYATRGWHEQPTEPEQTHPRVGPLAGAPRRGPDLDVDALLDDRRTGIIVCCGSGGVGKTTTSAALALRAAERGRKVVVLTIDPARRLAQSMGIEALDNTPRPVTGVGGDRLARRDDARHEAHLRRGRGGPGHPREGEADPGEPLLHRAVLLVRRDAGVHGDGEARPAPPRRHGGRQLRPDRRRHSTVPLGPGLPRRPGAAVVVPRRALRPDAARPGPWPGPDHDRGHRPRHQCAVEDPRRPVHHRPADLRRRARHRLRRLPGPRPADLRAAAGARHGVPRRGGPGGRRAARGGLLRRAAQRGPDAAGRPRRQPRQPGPVRARSRPTRR